MWYFAEKYDNQCQLVEFHNKNQMLHLSKKTECILCIYGNFFYVWLTHFVT